VSGVGFGDSGIGLRVSGFGFRAAPATGPYSATGRNASILILSSSSFSSLELSDTKVYEPHTRARLGTTFL